MDFPLEFFIPALSAILFGLGGFVYANRVEPDRIDITHIPLALPNLSREFNDYRLIQISDIHMGSWMNLPRLEEIVEKVNQLNPDLVAITGDFVTHHSSHHASELVNPLKKLCAPDGVMAVLGNHDSSNSRIGLHPILHRAGLMVLSNSVHTIRRGSASIHIAGVDDPLDRRDRLDIVLNKMPREGVGILLAHPPDFADKSAQSQRFDLQLSGHSHGGQVRFPLLGPLFLPRMGRKYPQGLYRVGNMTLYTNRGVGMVHLPVRFNCRPEITLFQLYHP
jgi:uncharacterized protein